MVNPDTRIEECEYRLSREFKRPVEIDRRDRSVYFPFPFKDRFDPRKTIKLVTRTDYMICVFRFDDSHIEYHRFLGITHMNEVKAIVYPQERTKYVRILNPKSKELSDDVSLQDLMDSRPSVRELLSILFEVHVRPRDDYDVVDPTGTCYTIPLPKGTTDIEQLRANLPPDIRPGYELTLLGNPLTSLRYTKYAKIEISYPTEPEQDDPLQRPADELRRSQADSSPRAYRFLSENRGEVSLRFDAEATVADAHTVLSDLLQLSFPPQSLWHIDQLSPDQLLSTIADDLPLEIRLKKFQPNEVRLVLSNGRELVCSSRPTGTAASLKSWVSQSLPNVSDLICHGKMVPMDAELQDFCSVSDVIYVMAKRAWGRTGEQTVGQS
jgi:hypothetical protein